MEFIKNIILKIIHKYLCIYDSGIISKEKHHVRPSLVTRLISGSISTNPKDFSERIRDIPKKLLGKRRNRPGGYFAGQSVPCIQQYTLEMLEQERAIAEA